MKKHSRFITLLVVLALVLTMTPMEAQAATKSAVLKKANAVTKSLTSYANYNGWEVKTKATKQTGKQVVKKLRVETADGGSYFSFKQVTKKSGKKYTTYFTAKGKRLRLQDVKRSIGLYSNSKTVKSFLKARSKKAAKSLASYGKARGWSTKVTTVAKKSNSVSKITFENKSYKFTAQVKVARNKKSPKKSFKLQGKASTAKVIKSWLEQFKDQTNITPEPQTTTKPSAKPGETETPSATETPSNPPSVTETPEASDYPAATEEPPQSTEEPNETETPNGDNGNLNQLVTIYVNDLTMVGKQHNWEAEITEEEAQTVILFKNDKWHFDAAVCVTDGKIVYKLMGDDSDREEIVSWLTEYEVTPTTTTDPSPTETPDDSPTGTEPPQSTAEPTETPSGDKTTERVAATVAMNELLVEAAQNGWSYAEVSNTGTYIQYLFKNSQREFKVSVGAKTNESGEIQVVYVLTTDADSIIIDKDEAIQNWFVRLSDNSEPNPSPSPSPIPNGPTAIGGGGNSGGSGAGDAQSPVRP